MNAERFKSGVALFTRLPVADALRARAVAARRAAGRVKGHAERLGGRNFSRDGLAISWEHKGLRMSLDLGRDRLAPTVLLREAPTVAEVVATAAWLPPWHVLCLPDELEFYAPLAADWAAGWLEADPCPARSPRVRYGYHGTLEYWTDRASLAHDAWKLFLSRLDAADVGELLRDDLSRWERNQK